MRMLLDEEDVYAKYLYEQMEHSHYKRRCEELEAQNTLLREELTHIRIESHGRFSSKYEVIGD
jgi:hypothetical protein